MFLYVECTWDVVACSKWEKNLVNGSTPHHRRPVVHLAAFQAANEKNK